MTLVEVAPAVADTLYDNGFLATLGTSGPTDITAVTINDDDGGYLQLLEGAGTPYRFFYWAAGTAQPRDFDPPTLRVRARMYGGTVADASVRVSLWVRNPTPTGAEDNYSFAAGAGTYSFSTHQAYTGSDTTWATWDLHPTAWVSGHGTLGSTGVGTLDLYDAYLAGNLAVRVEGITDGDGTTVEVTYVALLLNAGTPPLRQFPRDDGMRRNPARANPTSRQGTLRRGPRGTYT